MKNAKNTITGQLLSQIPQKGDPRLDVYIPRILKDLLKQAAKLSQRQIQGEVISRLSATFKHEEAYAEVVKLLMHKISP